MSDHEDFYEGTEEEDSSSYVFDDGDWDGDGQQDGATLDGEDDDDFHEDSDLIVSRLSSGANGIKYIELDEQIMTFMNDCIADFVEISGESYSIALSILKRFNWDKDEAVRQYLTDRSSGGTIITRRMYYL